VVVTFSEVTRLRRAEKQTRRLAAVSPRLHDAVILCDPTGTILPGIAGPEAMYGWREGRGAADELP